MSSPIPAFLLTFFISFLVYDPINAQEVTDAVQQEKQLPLPVETQVEIDSLKNMLIHTPPGVGRLKLYGNISWAYAATRTHLQSARLYADSMAAGARLLQNAEMMAKSHFYYGFIARHKGDFAKGLDHLQRFISYYEAQGDSVRVANGLFQVGVINHDIGNYEKSLAAYYRILSIWKQERDFHQAGTTLNSIAVILKKMKRFEDAVRMYHEAMRIFDSLGVEDRGYVRTNIANLYAENHVYEKAFDYYRQALQINRQYGNNVEVAISLQNLGTLYNKLKQFDTALAYHQQSFAILEHTTQQWEIAEGLKQLGYTFLMLKNYSKAEQYLQRSLRIATSLKAKPLTRDIFEDLALLSAARHQYRHAYHYHKLYAALKDSVLNEATTARLNELQVKYETSEKDRQIQLLAKEKEIQAKEAARQATLKKASIGGLMLTSMLAILLFYMFRQRLKNQRLLALKNKEVRESEFRTQRMELEMKALRAQINPHFLFNCMNSINHLILKGESANASSYLTKFAKLLRLILENAESNRVSLYSELSLLQAYIELEALRFKGRINYKISVDPAIQPESTYLPSMVIQPFVENAIWHGLMQKDEQESGNLVIDVKEERDILRCTIEDNGVGREKAEQLRRKTVPGRKSLGMKITEERLRLMNQGNNQQFIQITDLKDGEQRPAGTRIEINIPIA